jgi:hypothetical protein
MSVHLLQISFGLGKWLFYDSVPMQLGMFFTGVSPAGGASNIWTYILGGNINLSITMTTISTFAAFGKYYSNSVNILILLSSHSFSGKVSTSYHLFKVHSVNNHWVLLFCIGVKNVI